MTAKIVNARRLRREYVADLELDGLVVGRVERDLNMGGYRASDYVAKVGHTVVASGRTLADLREELRDPLVLEDLMGEATANEIEHDRPR